MMILLITISGCSDKYDRTQQQSEVKNYDSSMTGLDTSEVGIDSISLKDFFSFNKKIDEKVDRIFDKMTDDERIAQMIITSYGSLGNSEVYVSELIRRKRIGGVLMLGGSKEGFTNAIKRFNSISDSAGGISLIFSADAEPSLINKKISGVKKFGPTNTIKNEKDCEIVANDISDILKSIGVNQNYAPVCDFPYNKEIIGDRSYGKNEKDLVKLATEFVKVTQNNSIIATAKHFPGHGNVKGDSHKEIVYIKGDLKELNVFKEIIDAGVISVMVGHIAIENNEKYNTNGLPSTLSRKIVTDVLKNELGFKGLVVTDAMNMVAVSKFQTPSLKAIEAGCDMILMPSDEYKLILSVKEKMENDPVFREQVYESVRKVIRIKLCYDKINQ